MPGLAASQSFGSAQRISILAAASVLVWVLPRADVGPIQSTGDSGKGRPGQLAAGSLNEPPFR